MATDSYDTIQLGVLDGPHGGNGKDKDGKTIGDVAGYLETNYALFETFFAVEEDFISQQIEKSIADWTEEFLIRGIEPKRSPLQAAAVNIAVRFKEDIYQNKTNHWPLEPDDVPTKAALMGINHRFKSGLNNVSMVALKKFKEDKEAGKIPKNVKAVGDPRPNFIDTSLFVQAIMGWIENA